MPLSMDGKPSQKSDNALREALVDQIEYLALEAEALKQVVSIVPDEVLTGRPVDGEATLKEMYGLLVSLDEDAYLPCIEALSGSAERHSDNTGGMPVPEVDWNELGIADILDRLIVARRRLTSTIRQCSGGTWNRRSTFRNREVDLHDLASTIIQSDVDVLRAIGERLHTARLSAPRQVSR